MRISARSVQPGDTFALYLGNGVYAFARLVYKMEGAFYITEFFNHTSDRPTISSSVFESGRSIPLQNLDYTMLLSKKFYRWTPLLRNSDFEPNWEEIRNLEFRGGPGQSKRVNLDWTPESSEMRVIVKQVPSEKAEKLERWDTCWNPQDVYGRLRRHFGLKPYIWDSQADLMAWLYHNSIFFTPPAIDKDGSPAYGDWKDPIPKSPDTNSS